MGILEAVGELLFHPLMVGAERAWSLCFRPARREAVFEVWRTRSGWQHARTAVELVVSLCAVALPVLLMVALIVLLVRR